MLQEVEMFPVMRRSSSEYTPSGCRSVAVVSLLTVALFIFETLARGETGSKANCSVTESEIAAVILAIKDEIYVNQYNKEYLDIGADKVPVYINPVCEKGRLWLIYKLMPHGELFRGAYMSKDGKLALLEGDPARGFPPTHGASMKTVYLDDEDVIRMKTKWKKLHFSVELTPSPRDLQEAKTRQGMRFKLKHQD